jgi:hypothetical protein
VLSAPLATHAKSHPNAAPTIPEINRTLLDMGYNLAITQIEFFTIGKSRPSVRIHQQPFRWVANDPRRIAQGEDITYLVDQSDGATTSGLSSGQTEWAIDRSMMTWDNEKCLKKVDLVKRADYGQDPDIYDWFFGYGEFGDPFAADIVHAGWLPRAYFEAVGGEGGGRGTLAFSVTFIFTNENGDPTDVNGDNYLDTALNEVYYNDTFGDPSDDRAGNPWGIDIPLPGVDVETVSLHESGHSLSLGHFGPPPSALMNPVYPGIIHEPDSVDLAGMCTVWERWPM